MRYDELTSLTLNIIEQAGNISEPLKMDLENMLVESDSENLFLNSILEYLNIIEDDPLEYLNSTDINSAKDLFLFKVSINKLHGMVLNVLSIPLTMRNMEY